MAVKMRVIGGPKGSVKMAPGENGGSGTTLATSTVHPVSDVMAHAPL